MKLSEKMRNMRAKAFDSTVVSNMIWDELTDEVAKLEMVLAEALVPVASMGMDNADDAELADRMTRLLHG